MWLDCPASPRSPDVAPQFPEQHRGNLKKTTESCGGGGGGVLYGAIYVKFICFAKHTQSLAHTDLCASKTSLRNSETLQVLLAVFIVKRRMFAERGMWGGGVVRFSKFYYVYHTVCVCVMSVYWWVVNKRHFLQTTSRAIHKTREQLRHQALALCAPRAGDGVSSGFLLLRTCCV